MAELADALDLGSSGRPWGFKSLCSHQIGPSRTFKFGLADFFVVSYVAKGLELGASKLQFACSPKGEKIVQWTILREAREKQVPLLTKRVRVKQSGLI